MKPRIFGLTFLIFCCLAIEIYAENTENVALIYITKPLLIPLLIFMLFASSQPWKNKMGRFVVFGLLFSWVGDMLLMIREFDLFLLGLSSFLLAQVLYTIAFFSQRSTSNSTKYVASVLFGFILFYAAFMIFVQPHIMKLNDPVLAPAVFVYGAVICMMGIAAALRKGQVSAWSYRFIFVGALFFIASDAILATSKFTDIALPYPNFLVMSTYVLAQIGIVLGVVEAAGE